MTEGAGKTLDFAVFGAGRMGRIHAANLARQPGVRLRYVVDVDRDAAAALAARHGAQVADVDGAFGDPSVGATVICSSTDTHSELIMKSAAAGKHIFCEKPVDLAIERARQCADAVARAGVVCMIGFQRRFDPTFAALKARLDAGEIGTPEMLIVTSRDPGAPPVDYIRRSGGIFKDMLIHDFDIFRWILDDDADTVHATGSCLSDPAIADAGDIDSTAVTIRTKRGRLCQINTARRAAYGYDQRFEVLGSHGMLQAGNVRPTEVVGWSKTAVSQDVPEAFFLERYRAAYAHEIEHFYSAVMQGTPVRTTVADGLKALELAEAAALSWREGRAVKVGAAG
ncbi:inositol 2-dehydrogenase [Paraburkholderia caballeronis]|uniref:Myo-inositol 2-dehydrogenase n=1 Tax=Paraburkholderia caballeronis TaxID=416943 RepID=A0A1H7V3B4_9BURK|nr:inositol 2-dehydrogenase [Paraburkholderia caballeronis]PXW16830.1 myo-inositol 2-dehydrogenase [Paraburkholderia caballeronis]PXW94466.1 myo-inositol 2-dehydrogenase [Paraburkholderia caballeronis]RAJ89809.1 myo-inositol 2-dehydrogenase [Paraburkholderia caballeronis]TDV04602.1 myo-inositol 2-dehydrogenase [Paraburkholderia caballeronis]TDV07744.1 myo-inositol 2-dehydrogenase [Paraburkholderia caballeronis]